MRLTECVVNNAILDNFYAGFSILLILQASWYLTEQNSGHLIAINCLSEHSDDIAIHQFWSPKEVRKFWVIEYIRDPCSRSGAEASLGYLFSEGAVIKGFVDRSCNVSSDVAINHRTSRIRAK